MDTHQLAGSAGMACAPELERLARALEPSAAAFAALWEVLAAKRRRLVAAGGVARVQVAGPTASALHRVPQLVRVPRRGA